MTFCCVSDNIKPACFSFWLPALERLGGGDLCSAHTSQLGKILERGRRPRDRHAMLGYGFWRKHHVHRHNIFLERGPESRYVMEKKSGEDGGFIYASTVCHVTCIYLLTAMAGMSE